MMFLYYLQTRYFLKRSLGDFSCRGQLFQNAPYFLKRMSLK
ncbi:hypothetical protein HPHPH21_0578 [Helicobacter pylori Hp H-21]|nr:hypothetical protein HPHPH21_0578 [Helicobacter pylori Hp H-21]